MTKLFAGNHKIITENTVEITVQKTDERAIIYLFPIAKEILSKYSSGFKCFKIPTDSVENESESHDYVRKIDERIKPICKNAHFNEEITYTEQRRTKKKVIKKELHQLKTIEIWKQPIYYYHTQGRC